MEEVLRRFARLAGLTVEEAEQWQDLCGDAYVLLESQRKKQKDASCVGDLVCVLPLRWHFTNIHYIKMAAGQADFTSREMCAFLTTAKVWMWAKDFWLDARSHAAPLLKDPDFGFWEMKI